jgi:hypothetical protein
MTILLSSFTKESALVLNKAMCPGRKALLHLGAHNYWQIIAVRESKNIALEQRQDIRVRAKIKFEWWVSRSP